MHWEGVFWQGSEVRVAVMLDAGCEDEERDAEHSLYRGCGACDAGDGGAGGLYSTCGYFDKSVP